MDCTMLVQQLPHDIAWYDSWGHTIVGLLHGSIACMQGLAFPALSKLAVTPPFFNMARENLID